MEKKTKNYIFFVLLVTFISIFFGFIGGLITNEYVFPYLLKKIKGDEEVELIKQVIEKSYVEESSVIDVVKNITPSVVSIVIYKDFNIASKNYYLPLYHDPIFREFYSYPKEDIEYDKEIVVGGGTGFIFTNDGLILTSSHVVSDPNAKYKVILNDRREYEAEVIALDNYSDIGVIKLIPEDKNKGITGLKVVEFGNSSKIQIGQKVIAIGYALAEYDNTVTTGVVSAKGREIVASDFSGNRKDKLKGLIQTDAAINFGNSGGPLLNLKGEVIGINTAIATNALGIGFAIPINDAKTVISSIQKYGRIVRPMIGVRYTLLTKKLADNLGLKVDQGALVIGDKTSKAIEPGSVAEKSGLKENDIIVSIDNIRIDKDNDLRDIVSKYKVGDKIILEILRDNKTLKKELVLEEHKNIFK